MAQNADDDANAGDDSKRVTEDDLRRDKYGDAGVDNSGDTDEDEADTDTEDDEESEDAGDDDGKTDEDTEGEDSEEADKTDSEDDESVYVKEFPNIKGDTLAEYAKNLESTIRSSNTEGKRLSDENKRLSTENEQLRQQLATGATNKKGSDKGKDKSGVDLTDPVSLYATQKMNEEMQDAYTAFAKQYTQVNDTAEYNKFISTVRTVNESILNGQKRLASPKELYETAAGILKWKPDTTVDDNTKLKVALKDRAAVSKSTNSAPKKVAKTRLSEAEISANMRMYPNKTREQIIKELTPYIPNR